MTDTYSVAPIHVIFFFMMLCYVMIMLYYEMMFLYVRPQFHK